MDLFSWESVKDKIYPVLMARKEKTVVTKRLVTCPLMDMEILYKIPYPMEERTVDFYISQDFLKIYGIGQYELHEQAMQNLEKAGYELLDMEKGYPFVNGIGEELAVDKVGEQGMYLLRCKNKRHGASAVLNKEALRKVSDGRNLFILPSSINEVLLIPDDGIIEQWRYDELVQEVNESEVRPEERLQEHSFYYDAKRDELRIAA